MDGRLSRTPAPGTGPVKARDLIRWNDSTSGSTGTFGPFTFIVSRVWTGGGDFQIVPYIPGMKDRRARGDLAEVKAVAESWVREFVASLGAVFPGDPPATEPARTEGDL